jgi:hypothetical protein
LPIDLASESENHGAREKRDTTDRFCDCCGIHSDTPFLKTVLFSHLWLIASRTAGA